MIRKKVVPHVLAHKKRRTKRWVHHNQGVEKLFFSTLFFDPQRGKESIVYELNLSWQDIRSQSLQDVMELPWCFVATDQCESVLHG